ncbi:MAG: hypothetical protein IMZ55_15770, partial [Acidobacteria bacterium]|nr:hypothetical protein [Acidobacteriota bacterium]
LQHALAVWANVNKLEILRLEMLIDQHRRAQAEGDAQFNPAALEALQLELKDAYVDEGWVYTLREQATAQDGLDGRDSYGQALTAQKAAGQKQPWHDEFIKRSAQRAIYGMQHAMNVFGVMWTGFVDSVARLVNQTAFAGWVDTMSEATDRQIKEVQKKAQERLAALVALRRYGPAETRAMGEWLAGGDTAPADAAKLQALDDNRQFHEATAGGLSRMAAAFENDYDAALDKEYRIAVKHGQLALAEMHQAVNLKEGREAGGNDPLLKRMLDPMGTWKSACTHMRGSYDTMEDYLAERDGQLREMEGLRPRLLKMHWDLEYLERTLPENAKLHASLADRNPDYMAFLEKHRTIWLRKQQEVLYAEAAREEDPDERERLRHKAGVLQALAPQDAQVSMPPILKQQLLDRVAVLDYEGAVSVARELETFDPEGAKGLSAWLANDLSWEYAKDVGMSTWVSLGNGGLYTAFFARYFSPAAVRNAPVSLSNAKAIFASWDGFAGFLNFTWGRVNQFSPLTSGELTPVKLLAATATLTRMALETVEQDAIKKALLVGQFGMNDAYADFLAQALLNMQQMQTDDPRSLFGSTCRNVMRRLEAWAPAQIDVPNWKKTTTARAMLREYWQAVEARIELEKAMEGMRDAARGKAAGDAVGLTAITQAIAHARLKLRLLLSPLTADSVKAALDDYDGAIRNEPPLGRLKAQAELFKALPCPRC